MKRLGLRRGAFLDMGRARGSGRYFFLMNIIIVGAGEIGRHLATSLAKEAHRISLIESDKALAEELESTLDAKVIHGNGTSVSDLADADVGGDDDGGASEGYDSEEGDGGGNSNGASREAANRHRKRRQTRAIDPELSSLIASHPTDEEAIDIEPTSSEPTMDPDFVVPYYMVRPALRECTCTPAHPPAEEYCSSTRDIG
jgi:hypothetical protein